MKILWIVNTIFPEPSKVLGIQPPVTGGWMFGLSEAISSSAGVKLSVATAYPGKTMQKHSIDNIDYYLIPCKDRSKYDKKLEDYWQEICLEYKPDIVHIHGTELAHGLACMRSCPDLNYVISIQGLVSVIEKYYYADISHIDILKNITFKDIVTRNSIFQEKIKFQKRGVLEKEYIQRTKHVIGRTSWDRTHVQVLNNNLSYHFCNESLRTSFYYAPKWSLENCIPYTIFLSQASYPIKGIHQVLKAINLLKDRYPNIKLRVGGANIIKSKSLKDKLRLSGYGKYIKGLVKDFGLENKIEFLGFLDENKMIDEYLKCNLFICPSSIENSPNSLGEAQLLGVPVVSAYVGGVPNMVEHEETGLLYRFEEIEMLAEQIQRIFKEKYLVEILSSKGMEAANFRHNRTVNLEVFMNIYNDIVFTESVN